MDWEDRLGVLLTVFVMDFRHAGSTEEKLARLRVLIDDLEQLYYQTATGKGLLPRVRYLAAKRWVDAAERGGE